MSDSEDYSREESYDESRERSYDESDEDEDEMPRPNKQSVKYISDGLTENDYKMSNVANDGLVRSECCLRFFTKDGYMHQTKYGLKIPGMNTCIHCYISFNSNKFVDGYDMTPQDEDCLRYYVNTFVDDHQTTKCTKTGYGGQCILCNSIRGVYPPLIVKDMKIAQELNASNTDNTDIFNNFNNIRFINRPTSTKTPFVLVL